MCVAMAQPSEAGPTDTQDGVPPSDEGGTPDAAACVDGPNRFCDAFDDDNPGSRWSSRDENRGAVTFEDGGASPPRALTASIVPATGTRAAALYKDFDPPLPRTVRCEFYMKLVKVAPLGQLHVIRVITATTGEPYFITLFARNSAWFLAEYRGPEGSPQVDQEQRLSAELPTDLWVHVVLDVGESVATLTVANNAVATLMNLQPPSGTKRSVAMGIALASGAQEKATVLIDNVDCSTTQ